jgi:CHAD domain-containing protein
MSSHILALAMEEPGVPASDSGKDNAPPESITAATSAAAGFVLLATPTSAEAVRRAHTLHAKSDPEVLHKLRVALRRLRSLWWAYEPLLDKKDAKLQRDEFKYLADAAGRTRDWDVLRDILAVDQRTRLSLSPLLLAVDEHRANALSFSRRTIRSAGVEEILQRALEGARHQLDSRAASLTLSEFAEERVELAEKALKKRYLLEFFSPVLGGSHESAIERLTSVQDELGKLNDLVTSETLLREYVSQLGEPKVVKEAVRCLEDQKKHRMCTAHEILRTSR